MSTRRPMKQKSEKAKAFDKEFEIVKPEVRRRSKGKCEFRTSVCTGRAGVMHHIGRRRGDDANSAANIAHICWECHDYVHANDAEAHEEGWLRHSWEPLPEEKI